MTAVVPLDTLRRSELMRLAGDNSFGLPRGEADSWFRFAGLGIPHVLHAAGTADGKWLIGIAHTGIMEEMAVDHPGGIVPGPNGSMVICIEELGPALRRMAELARGLPSTPLDRFVEQTRDLPRTTEAERSVVQRVGQDEFRKGLLEFWNGRCPLTGIAHERLLRASHMKPWAHCGTDDERLDVYNGLLLAAHLDAAFDAGLIGFETNGTLIKSPALSCDDVAGLNLSDLSSLQGLRPEHQPYLAYHRRNVFREEDDR